MVDTISLTYRCSDRRSYPLNPETWEAMGLEVCEPGFGDLELPSYRTRSFGKGGMSMEAWEGKSDELGWVGVQRFDNTWTLKAERSLPKWLDGDNCRLLTAKEAQEAVYAYDAAIRAMAPFVDARTVKVTRLDICYQQHVGDTRDVIDKLHGALAPRWSKSCARYDTSLEMRGRQRGFRVYDKGAESGNESYHGYLRMEEQLRTGGIAMRRACDGLRLSREGCLELINERTKFFYEAVFQPLPVEELMSAGRWTVLFLAMHPEYEGAYKRLNNRSTVYRIMKQVRELRAGATGVDLTVPADAWAEVLQ